MLWQQATNVQKWNDTIAWAQGVEASKKQRRNEGTARAAVTSSEESQHAAHFDPGSVQQIIVDVFGPDAPAALAVAKCESHYNADAVNGRYRGVFQVGDLHAAYWLEVIGRDYWESWMDPVANVTFAHALFLSSGWGPWSCKPG